MNTHMCGCNGRERERCVYWERERKYDGTEGESEGTTEYMPVLFE